MHVVQPRRKPFKVFLVMPARDSERIGSAMITSRVLPVLAACTPQLDEIEDLRIVDMSIEPFPFDEVRPGDLVGISAFTSVALSAYELARKLRQRHGATVVMGGAHVKSVGDEPLRLQCADAIVDGDGEVSWPQAVRDFAARKLETIYKGGLAPESAFVRARWDLLPHLDRYVTPTVQTVRGCMKSCSFCSVWVQDGRKPRQSADDDVIAELQYLYAAGFRLVILADDNFYPYSIQDIAKKAPEHRKGLEQGRQQRLQFLDRLANETPSDMMFGTQIVMEVADDAEYLRAMNKARVYGALIGIESVTQEGLDSIDKEWNYAGEELKEKLAQITEHVPFILGSVIMGLPGNTPPSLRETIDVVPDLNLAVGQFPTLNILPGTKDWFNIQKGIGPLQLKTFGAPDWVREYLSPEEIGYWLDPANPRIVWEGHPHFDGPQGERELLDITHRAWNEFYTLRNIWRRREFLPLGSWRRMLGFMILSRNMNNRYQRQGLAQEGTVSETKSKRIARLGSGLSLRFIRQRPQVTLPVHLLQQA